MKDERFHEKLNIDVLKSIFYLLDNNDYKNLRLVCKYWHTVILQLEEFYKQSVEINHIQPLKKLGFPVEEIKTTWQEAFKEHKELNLQRKVLKVTSNQRIRKLLSYQNILAGLHSDGMIDYYHLNDNTHILNDNVQNPSLNKDFTNFDIRIHPNDENKILSCSLNGDVRLETVTDTRSITLNLNYAHQINNMYTCSFVQNGYAVAGCYGGGLFRQGYQAVKFSPNSRILALLNINNVLILSADKDIKILDCQNATFSKMMRGHTNLVTKLVRLDNNLVSAGYDNNTIHWDLDLACSIRTYHYESHLPSKGVSALSTFNHQYIICGGFEMIHMWDIRVPNNHTPVASLQDDKGYVSAAVISKWNLFSSNLEGSAKVWDLRKKQSYRTISEADEKACSTALILNEEENEFYVGWTNGAIQAFKL